MPKKKVKKAEKANEKTTKAKAFDISISVPTYNERENIAKLIGQIDNEFKSNGINGEIIIVDDNSPDGTGRIADELAEKYKFVRVIHRKGKEGLSSAVLAGFAMSKSDIVGVMDADLSHPVNRIHTMLNVIKTGKAEFVVGSRYMPEGDIIGWNTWRLLMSRGAIMISRLFTRVRDTMSGFFMIRKKCIEGKKLDPKGFKILLELLIKADYDRVVEVPIVFINRTEGKSKAGTKEILDYLRNVWGYIRAKMKDKN